PFCSGSRASAGYSLLTEHPDIANEWHHDRNGELRPSNVTPASRKQAWWRCPRGHEWEARISHRTIARSGCPYCSGQLVSPETCLAATHAELASEWHPERNGALTAAQVSYGSGKRVWWLCSRGHEWQATVNSRTNMRSGCPTCAAVHTSTIEEILRAELRHL